jgi:hypothetical protein
MNINIEVKNRIPYDVEKYIIKLINMKPPKSYAAMSEKEINYIHQYIRKKFSIDINPQIILSIKSAYMKNHIISKHYRLNKYLNNLIKEYPTNNIIDLCTKYDIPPMSILRLILETKYNMKMKQIISNREMLSAYDLEQLDLAIGSDIYNQFDQQSLALEAAEFENKVGLILKKYNISFRTQEELVKEQVKLYGKAINTPDFLIDSELVINNVKINWIDAKNFYGSNIPFVKTKIHKQIQKYIQEYGSGCIVFGLGFSTALSFPDTLLLSYDSIKHGFWKT